MIYGFSDVYFLSNSASQTLALFGLDIEYTYKWDHASLDMKMLFNIQ